MDSCSEGGDSDLDSTNGIEIDDADKFSRGFWSLVSKPVYSMADMISQGRRERAADSESIRSIRETISSHSDGSNDDEIEFTETPTSWIARFRKGHLASSGNGSSEGLDILGLGDAIRKRVRNPRVREVAPSPEDVDMLYDGDDSARFVEVEVAKTPARLFGKMDRAIIVFAVIVTAVFSILMLREELALHRHP